MTHLWPTYHSINRCCCEQETLTRTELSSDMDTFFDNGWHCNGWKLSRWKYAKSFGSYTHQSYEYNFIQFLRGWSLHVLSFCYRMNDWVYPVYPAGLLFVYVWYMIGILQPFTAVELIYGIYHDTHLQPFTQPFYNHVLSMYDIWYKCSTQQP